MEEFKIFQKVMQCLDEKEDIKDEMLFYILNILSDRFVESRDDSEWLCYDQLLDQLSKIWQYKQFEEISSEQSYLYGAIWGGLSMLSSIKKKKTMSQKCHTLAEKYKSNSSYIFLHSILNKPGIQNKKLADLCGVTTARISQIATDALEDGLISVQAFGKEKSYYMRTMGESVHDIIQKNRTPVINVLESFDCKFRVFSNNGKSFPIKNRLEIYSMNHQYKNIEEALEINNSLREQILKQFYEINSERTNTLCMQKTKALSTNLINSWKPQREADMINQP